VKEYEGNGRGTSGNKCSVAIEEGESWIGDDGDVGKTMGNTGSYLEREENFSFDIVRKYEGKEEERQGEDLIVIV